MSLVVSASSSVWSKKKVSVPSGQTVTLDKVSANSFCFFEYKLVMKNAGGTLVRSLVIDGHQVSGGIVDRVYSKAGSGIDYTLTANIVSGSLELDLVNNEAFDLRVGFARILVDA